jgi:ADP-ribosylglycohydrolase
VGGRVSDPIPVMHHGYLRWLHTQGFTRDVSEPDGWLVSDARLHRREAPGNTCLSALASGWRGSPEEPINDSKGCGGVMRAAPVGLFWWDRRPEEVYRLGCEVAAITHGHPDGFHSAGALAVIVSMLLQERSLEEAIDTALGLASPNLRDALEKAIELASTGLPHPEMIERQLGGGWVGEEALAIALCCALATRDVQPGLIAAVNHSGDADSTGAICGNILGATAASRRGGGSATPAREARASSGIAA